ncbi:hypothetical protein JTY60_00055 [symbiont of Argiope bruennichi]|uniref:hypothetical protein n=1 Tax=symbiont of Argiope bruennichi TaxID=2810479 RepID=UPI003DA48B2C
MHIDKIPNAKRKKIFYFFSLSILFFSAGCSISKNSKNHEIPSASVTSATNMNDYKNVSLPVLNDFNIRLYYHNSYSTISELASTDWQILTHNFDLKNILSANSFFSFDISANLKFWYSSSPPYYIKTFSESMFSGNVKDCLCYGKVREFDWNFNYVMYDFSPSTPSDGTLSGALKLFFKVIDNSIALKILVYYSSVDLISDYFWANSKVIISDVFDNKNLVNFFN